MVKIEDLIENRLVQNLLVWLFVFVVALFSIRTDQVVLASLVFVAGLSIPVYINNLFILPRFFYKNKLTAVLFFALNVLVTSFLIVFFISNFLMEFEWRMLYNMIALMTLIMFFASAIKIARDSIIKKQQEKEAELQLLKGQLNPHFLFNTLNNLYGLSVVKSDNLPKLMLKLSDLLRYSLYSTKDTFVPLEKEIEYLENYIALEKIRLENKTQITFEVTGVVQDFLIAPMLLIVFVENAFKHLETDQKDKSLVAIQINCTDNNIHFRCENTSAESLFKDNHIEAGGIGLKNAKKRLELIYPNSHRLKITKHPDTYIVDLNIHLK